MMSDLQHLLLPAVEYFRSYTAWIAFTAAFGETLIGLGFFIPGSTLLLFMGVLAGQGYIDIKTVLLFGLAGAYAGDLVNYRLGRRHGAMLLQKPWLHLPEETLEKSRKFLNTHGAKSLFFARFIPGLKESVSFLAGSMKMDRGKFLFWDFLGAVGWSLEFIGIGFLFSTSLALAQLWLSRTVTTIAVFTLLLFLLYLLKRFVVQNAPAAKTVLSALWHAFLTAGPVKRFSASHPKLTLFLRRRIDSSVFTGLPLTLFALALLYLLALFGGTVEDILTKDPIVYADRIVANLIVQWRTPELTAFFTWITYLGKVEVLLAFLAAATAILLLYRRYEQIVALYFSIAGSALFVYLGKLVLHRPRPETAIYFESTYSFPSAHAAAAVAFYGFLAYLLMRERKSFKTRINIFFTVTVLILLIGFSRIYLGEHYLSDVYGGYLVGTLWFIAAVALLHWLLYKKAPGLRAPFRYAKPVGYLALFTAAGFYFIFGTHYHYKPMPKTKSSVSRIENPMQIFDNPDNRFVRNIFGLESRPVTIVVAAPLSLDLCKELKRSGWHTVTNEKLIELPLFWHSEEPLCRLYKTDAKIIYLLDIWSANASYKELPLYVASSDAVQGRKWDILPVYSPDIGESRTFAAKALKSILPMAKSRKFQAEKPFIAERLLAGPYFFDGNIVYLEAAQKGPISAP